MFAKLQAVKSDFGASVRMRIWRIKKYSHYPLRKNRGLQFDLQDPPHLLIFFLFFFEGFPSFHLGSGIKGWNGNQNYWARECFQKSVFFCDWIKGLIWEKKYLENLKCNWKFLLYCQKKDKKGWNGVHPPAQLLKISYFLLFFNLPLVYKVFPKFYL